MTQSRNAICIGRRHVTHGMYSCHYRNSLLFPPLSMYQPRVSEITFEGGVFFKVNLALYLIHSYICISYSHTYVWYICTANPTWGDIFEYCFKAQSSKLERLFSLKRGKRDVRALSFELSKLSPQVGLAVSHTLIHMCDTARSVEDETRNAELNGNRNPECWGDFSQLVKIEKIKYLGISRYKVELRFRLDLNSEVSRGTNSKWDFCWIWICSWLKSPQHSGFRLPFNSVFRVSSSTERAVLDTTHEMIKATSITKQI